MRARRTLFESLEDRQLLAVITVTSLGASVPNDGNVSLQEAVIAANTDTSVDGSTAGAGADLIEFAAGLTGTVALTDQLTLDTEMTINGPGASVISISGNDITRIFNIADGAGNIALRDLTLTNGLASAGESRGGAIFLDSGNNLLLERVVIANSSSTGAGGAIAKLRGAIDINESQLINNETTLANAPGGALFSSSGDVTITDSTISGNRTVSDLSYGGGIYIQGGNLSVTASTISNNTTSGNFADGAGIFSDTDLTNQSSTIVNSTISGNTSSGRGGGVFNRDGLTVIRHSTITNNTASGGQAGESGGGVGSYGDAATRTEVESTIISGNTGGDIDFAGGTTNSFLSLGFNLIGDGNGTGNFNIAGDNINVTDPELEPLADNGGPTLTHALMPSSPAVDTGNPTFDASTLPNDQRGAPFLRVANGRIDIGSFESGDAPPTISDIPDQAVAISTPTGAIAFVIGDTVTAASALVVTATSSNQALVPDANILLGGTDGNRTITVTPVMGVEDFATITVTVTDEGGLTATDTFLLTVGNPNSPPSISDIDNQTVESGLSTGDIAFTIDDQQTALATLAVTASSSDQTLVPDANIILGGTDGNRTIAITPTAGQTGMAIITVTVTDEGGLSATDTFVLTVTPANTPPTISDIVDQSVAIDTPTATLTFSISDMDTAASALVVTATSSVQTLVPDANIVLGGTDNNRTIVATPAAGQTGTATITVTVTDAGGLTATDTFLLTVGGANTSPTISDIADQTVETGESTADIAFTIGDAESALNTLQVTAVSSNQTLLPDSNITLGGADGNRTIALTPATGQTGTATITVTVTDEGGLIATDTILLTVVPFNMLPTISDIADQTTTMNVPLTAIDFTISDAESSSSSLVVTGTSSNQTLVPNANIVFGGTTGDRNVTITPAAGQIGTTRITVTVTDEGGKTATDTFLLTVNPPNAPPTISSIGNRSVLANMSTPPIGFTVNDAETLAGNLVVTAVSSDQTLVRDQDIVIAGIGTDRTVAVTPVTDQIGMATITLTVTDAGGLFARESFILRVTAPNAVPTITSIANQTVEQNMPTAAIPFTIGDAETAVGALLVSATSSNQTLIPDANIVLAGTGADRTVTLTPAPDQIGSATIMVSVTDRGGATITELFVLTVTPVNQPPSISNIIDQSVRRNQSTVAIPFTVTDRETLSGSLVIAASSSDQSLVPDANIQIGGLGIDRSLTITPATGQLGMATITVTVTDEEGLTATDTFVLTVTPENTPPTISGFSDQSVPRNAIAEVDVSVFDQETMARFLEVTATSSNQSLVTDANIEVTGSGQDRTITIAPTSSRTGSSRITVTVTDEGGLTATNSFVLTVFASNARPTISDVVQQSVPVNTSTAPINFTVSDPETLASSLVVTATSSNQLLIPDANIQLSGDGSDRSVTITPAADQTGSTTITLTVTDEDGATDTDTFLLTVIPANQPPTITAIPDVVGTENTPTSPIPFTVGDAETSASALVVSTSSSNRLLVPDANIAVNGFGASRSLTITPVANQIGNTTITVTVTDSGGESTTETFELTVMQAPPSTSVSFAASAQSRLENAGMLAVTLSLSAVSDSPISVPFTLTGTSANGSDYTISQSPVLIDARASSAEILIDVIDDNTDEPNETIIIRLGTPAGAALGAQTVHTVTILDNDEPVVVVPPTVNLNTSSQNVGENVGIVTVTAVLSKVSDSPVNVPFSVAGTATGNAADYTIGSSPIVIPPGQLSADLTIGVIEDVATESDETIIVSLGIPTGATLGTTTVQTITILDNDSPVTPTPPSVSLSSPSQSAVESDGNLTVTATLSEPTDSDVIIPFIVTGTAVNGADFTITISPITITPGNTTADITISLNDDDIDENNETVVVALGTPTGATLGSRTVHTATIIDNDDPPVVTTPRVTLNAASQTGPEEGGPLSVTATLSQPSASIVTVPFTVSGSAENGTDFTITASPLTFAPGSTTASISINVNDDLIDEGNETVVISLGTPVGADLGATTMHIATIVDNDGVSTGESRIIIPSAVAGSHVIAGDGIPTAILFRALQDTVLTVGQVGTTSAAEQLTLLDEDLAPVGGHTASGLFEANLVAGNLYALVFQARDANSIFVIRSSAGADALSGSSPTNLLRPTDVNGDGESTALDALMIVNQLKRQSVAEGEDVHSEQQSGRYYDVNRDGLVTTGDALLVINELSDEDPEPAGEVTPLRSPLRPAGTAAASPNQDHDDVAVEASAAERTMAFDTVTSELRSQPIVVVDFQIVVEDSSNVDRLLSDESFLDDVFRP